MSKNIKYCLYKADFILALTLSSACVPLKQLNYFNDLNELDEPGVNPRKQKLIMPFDKLYIKVLSIDAQTSQIFNVTEEMRSGGSNGILGYLVNENGDVTFP